MAIQLRQVWQCLAAKKEADALMEALETSLRAQAAWFHFTGDDVNALCAAGLAASPGAVPAAQNPLLSYMIGLGLVQIMNDK